METSLTLAAQADLDRRLEALKSSLEWHPEKSPRDGVISDEISMTRDGELFATGPDGGQKLDTLKSGAYLDTFVDYLRGSALHGAEWRSAVKSGSAMKVLQEGQDNAGGFWSPVTLRNELIKKATAPATIRPNARVITTSSDMTGLPSAVYTTDDKHTSGARFTWITEAPASDLAESTNPVAGRVNIPCHVALCYTVISRSLFEDSLSDVLGILADLMGDTYGMGEEDAFWNGNGVGKPQGILNHPNIAIAASAGGCYVISGAASAATWGGTTTTALDPTVGILGVDASLPPQYEKAAKWYFNKTTKASLASLVNVDGSPYWPEQNAFPGAADGYQASLRGYPVERAQWVPDIAADAYPVWLADMQGFYITERPGLSIEVLTEPLGLQDEVIVLARKRVGGQLVQPWRVRNMKIAAS